MKNAHTKDTESTVAVILPPRFKLQVGVTMVCSGWVKKYERKVRLA